MQYPNKNMLMDFTWKLDMQLQRYNKFRYGESESVLNADYVHKSRLKMTDEEVYTEVPEMMCLHDNWQKT